MSPTRRSQTLHHQQQPQPSSQNEKNNLQQHAQAPKEKSVQQTPSKKSPFKGGLGIGSLMLGSTAATAKDGNNKSRANSNAGSAFKDDEDFKNSQSSDIKELKLTNQRSQTQQQAVTYNLRSASNSHQPSQGNRNTAKDFSGQERSTSKSKNVSALQSPNKLSSQKIKPFDTRLTDKENMVEQSTGYMDMQRGNSNSPKKSMFISGGMNPPILKANKTLNLKNTNNQITTNPQKSSLRQQSRTFEQGFKQKNHHQEIRFRFETQKLNLPRGKVIRCSPQSSAYGSKRNSQSPVKLPRNMPPLQEAPMYQQKTDYFKEYWRMYFQNESIVADIEQTAHSNYKTNKKIYNLEDYYEHYLIPQMVTYPHKFLHRLKQHQIQKQQQQQKLMLQQKQQQELMLQMKNQSLEMQMSPSKHSSREGGERKISGVSSHDDQTNSNIGSSNKDEISSQSGQNHKEGGSSNQSHQTIQPQIHPHHMLGLNKDRAHKRKKHQRRTAAEIEREFICPYSECGKFYGSEGSLNLHIKIKHNGGNKTERERLAKTLVQAYLNGNINREIDQLDLNLPPGSLQKAVKKAGLVQQVSENEILRQITTHFQHGQVVASQVVIGQSTNNRQQAGANNNQMIQGHQAMMANDHSISHHSSAKSHIDLGGLGHEIDLEMIRQSQLI